VSSPESAAPAASASVSLEFDRGTLVVRGIASDDLSLRDARFDARVGALRAPAYRYAELVLGLRARGLAFADRARAYKKLESLPEPARLPRPYQAEALASWRAAGRRGTVVLPTGAGKTFVAVLALRDAARSTLVVAPTIDLLHQWYSVLAASFPGVPIGAVGGGEFTVQEITVTTYDSAYLHLDRLGDRFGLVVFDEAHHLPGATYSLAARLAIAPFRLALTATPERTDGGEHLLSDLVGPLVYRKEIKELAGEHLASYEVVPVLVALSPEERARYEAARARFRGYLDARGIRLGGPNGWRRFLLESSRDPEGREAFAAWREQRRIALATPRKLEVLDAILARHGGAGDRVLVFTDENEAAYEVSSRFLVPAITHQTKPRERRAFLEGFASGRFPVLATSRVLNEGVDVPDASVAVVLSGSATVREHVQRLGRILRPKPGKLALLYEVVAQGTGEENASARRRQHDAYR
jgi:superfamily II DNA or RNA helicase